MCGSATLTMVVSSTWISVADITASVIMSRLADRRWPAHVAECGARVHGMPAEYPCDQDAARDLVQQRRLLVLAPPARQAVAIPVADDDEVRADAFRHLRDVHHRDCRYTSWPSAGTP